MKIKRAACVPLITHDPFFSVWSPADQLHDTNTVHWSGAPQRRKGFLTVEEWGNMRIMTAAVCQQEGTGGSLPGKYTGQSALWRLV